MRYFISVHMFIIVSAIASIAAACFPCGTATVEGEFESFCASPSQGLWDGLLQCVARGEGDPAGGCGNECAAWLAALDRCATSGDPMCAPIDLNGDGVLDASDDMTACNECMAGSPSPPYAGIGCAAANNACSADRTGCVTCASYLGGQSLDLVCYSAANGATDASAPDASALSACACSGACSVKCAGSCGSFFGFKWFDTSSAPSSACNSCLKNRFGCGAQRVACLAN